MYVVAGGYVNGATSAESVTMSRAELIHQEN